VSEAAVRAAGRLGHALAVAAACLAAADAWAQGGGAELPRARVDTTLEKPRGATVLVKAGADLQAALDAAQPGDVLALEAGATFTGPFTLPDKTGSDWIIVRPALPDERLPPPGTRVDPSQAGVLPKLEAASGSVLKAAPGAHHYRFVGLELRPRAGTFLYNLVELGASEATVPELPHHIVFDRCYLHGDPARGTRRGIALNSWHTAVVDSYLSDFKEAGADSQAIGGWNGMGPFKIENNYLEGAGENVMFGGAVPAIHGLVPSDIEVRRNHFAKPVSWRAGDPSYAGTAWTVKNLFELKNARRVLVDGNVFEHNWVQAQNGFAILFTVRTEDGDAPWAVVEDVTFSNNVVRHAAAGVNILGYDPPSGQTRRVVIRNNLFDDIGGPPWGGGRGTLLQMLEGAADVVFDHNTARQTGPIVLADGKPSPGFVYRNNIAPHNDYGIIGSGAAPGTHTLGTYFPGATVARNVIAGGRAEAYPRDNFFPASLAEVGFVDPARGDLRLAPTSPYRAAATDGKEVGVVLSELPAGPAPLPGRALPAAPTAGPASRSGPPPRIAEAVFWICALLLAYTHAGYPLLVGAWAALRPRPFRRGPEAPRVSVLVPARNEAARIAGRIENLLALDYPPGRFEVLVGSDGSTDRTEQQARAHEGKHVRVLAFPTRRGKAAVLNALVPEARGEIVVLADVRQRFEPGALRALVAPFADPRVGAVSGELLLGANPGETAVGEGVGFYWRYEKFIRRSESRVDSTVGATGAIYAIRRRLFVPLPEDTLLDDVLVPMRIVRGGYRTVFEPAARAHDRAAATAGEEFRRKVRTIAGNFQLFARNRWLLDPRHNRLWLQVVSHKGLRLVSPVLLAGALAANVALIASPLYRATLAVQGAFYAAALTGAVLRNLRKRVPLLTVPYVICLLSWATIVAFARFCAGRQPVTWEPASA
jgi:glycosyltransferase involved in cell wall biosynthesis